MPILIVQGEDDQYGTVRQIEVAQEECYCPVEVALLPDTRHAPYREAPAGDAARDRRLRQPAAARSPRRRSRRQRTCLPELARCGESDRPASLRKPMADAERKLSNGKSRIDFQTDPSKYRHWKLEVDGEVATLLMDVDEKGTLFEGYELKLNSYDLGVDIELADAIERLRFEHPQVKVILLRSGKPRVFCAGANIRMLAGATHAHKVNFCKFTNETRNGIEDASEASGLATICVINGTAAGGGYELALAADHIMLIDDGSSTVSLPELPLLAVLPGTGGLTRVTDKRKVRRDHADVFCTTEEGIKGKRAVDWRLVDEVVPGSKLEETVAKRAQGIRRQVGPAGRRQGHRARRRSSASARPTASSTARSSVELRARRSGSRPSRVRGPEAPPPASADAMVAQGARVLAAASSRASSTMPSSTSAPTSSTSRRSCSSRPAIRRRCSPTTRFSTPTRTTGSRARSGACGSACSSASI